MTNPETIAPQSLEKTFTREDLVRDTILGRAGLNGLIETAGFTREELRRDTYIATGENFPRRLICAEGFPPNN